MLDVSAVHGGSVVYLVGELDLEAEARLREMLSRQIATDRRAGHAEDLVIDLGGVTFMDSSGLSAILWACRELGPERNIRLLHLDRMVRRVIEMTGVLAIGNLVVDDEVAAQDGDGDPGPTSG